MKKLFKFIRNLIILIIIILVAAVLLRNYIVTYAAPPVVKAALGVPVSIDKADISLTESFVGLDGLKAGNPPGFPDENMLTMPEIFVNYNISSLLKDKIHLEELRVDIASVTVIQNKDGAVNILALLPPEKEGEEAPKKPGRKRELQIDLLRLKIGEITLKDYTGDGEPIVKTITVGIDEEHENVTNPEYLGTLIATKVLLNSSINELLDLNVSSVLNAVNVDDILNTGGELGSTISKQGAEILEKVGSASSSNEVTETIQDAAKKLKDLF